MNKMSAKIKWTVGLLILRIIGSVLFSIATIGNLGRILNVEFDSLAGYFVFAFLYEQLPTIAAIILIFYNHEQTKTENTGFTLMQKWVFTLVWAQQAYSLLSFALLGIFAQLVWSWLGGCIWLGVITYLLYSAWKNQKTVEQERINEPKLKQQPEELYLDAQNQEQIEDNEIEYVDNHITHKKFFGLIFVLLVLITIIGIIISAATSL